jgi:hypothetical protein
VRIAGAVDCVCMPNEVAISGGAYAIQNNSVNASQSGASFGDPLGIRLWRSSCTDGTNRTNCSTPFAVCLRVQ